MLRFKKKNYGIIENLKNWRQNEDFFYNFGAFLFSCLLLRILCLYNDLKQCFLRESL